MTYDELLAKIDEKLGIPHHWGDSMVAALRAVVELHKPRFSPYNGKTYCNLNCYEDEGEGERYEEYPCHTIQAIEKELK
jgi:hypothetical protein